MTTLKTKISDNCQCVDGVGGAGKFIPIGIIDLVHNRANGQVESWREYNLITNVGFATMASRLGGAGGESAATYLALGTDNTAAAVTDTTLGSEISTSGGSRAAATASRVTTNVTNDSAQLQYTFSFTGTLAINEIGVFNAASSGSMISRSVLGSTRNVENGDSLQVTYKHVFAA